MSFPAPDTPPQEILGVMKSGAMIWTNLVRDLQSNAELKRLEAAVF